MISGSPTRASSDPRRRREERNFSQTWLQTGVKEERVHSTFHFGKKKLTFAVMMMSQFTMTVSREKKPNKNAAVADNDDVHGVCYLVGGPNFEKKFSAAWLGHCSYKKVAGMRMRGIEVGHNSIS